MSDKNTPDVMDHAEAELQKLSTRHAFWQTKGPYALMLATAFKFHDEQVKQSTWQRYQAYKMLKENKLWGELPRDMASAIRAGENGATRQNGQIQFCRNSHEAAQSLGISRDTIAALEFVDGKNGADGAIEAETFALLPPAELRRFSRLDKSSKAELVRSARDIGQLDERSAAEKLIDLIGSYTAAANQAREQAEAETEAARKAAADAEAKARKREVEAKNAKDDLTKREDTIRELQDRLDTPGFCKGAEEIAGILRRHFDQTFAALGHFERAAEALAVRVEHGEPNEELNVIALQALEFAINLWGNAMGKYLPALDPGQEHISFWAANDTFTSPRTQEKINEYLKLLTPKTGKKGTDE
jgi:hypothetical protein